MNQRTAEIRGSPSMPRILRLGWETMKPIRKCHRIRPCIMIRTTAKLVHKFWTIPEPLSNQSMPAACNFVQAACHLTSEEDSYGNQKGNQKEVKQQLKAHRIQITFLA